jgi:hypothetical protein
MSGRVVQPLQALLRFVFVRHAISNRGCAGGIWRTPMRRWIATGVAAALLGAGTPSFAQQQASPNAHPAPIIEGQSAVPPPGGIDPTGDVTPTAASPPPSGPLPPGPPAGDEQAQHLANGALIVGGVAITAAVVCALACFSNSTSTTTSTTVVHH